MAKRKKTTAPKKAPGAFGRSWTPADIRTALRAERKGKTMADDRDNDRIAPPYLARNRYPADRLADPLVREACADQPIRVSASARPTPAVPHAATTRAVVMAAHTPPTVVFSEIALAKMARYVGFCAEEVGWLGFVDHDEGSSLYTVFDVVLFKQRVHAATTEISADALAEMTMELLDRPDGMELVNKMRFWGHSHVNMAVSPSGQDDAQMQVFASNDCEFMIRAICNKRGEMKVDVYDYEVGIQWMDAQWENEDAFDPLDEEIISEMESKVSSIRYATVKAAPLTPPGGDYKVRSVQRGLFAEDGDDDAGDPPLRNGLSADDDFEDDDGLPPGFVAVDTQLNRGFGMGGFDDDDMAFQPRRGAFPGAE